MALYVGAQGSGGMRQLGALYTTKQGSCAELGALYTSQNGVVREVFAPGRLLYDCAVGDIVTLRENGVPARYIVCDRAYRGNGNVLLLRERASVPCAYWDSQEITEYEGSMVDTYLTGAFLDSLDLQVRASLAQVALPVRCGEYGSQWKTIPRAVFLLSLTEIGAYPQADNLSPGEGDGTLLPWFAQRIAQLGQEPAWKCINDAEAPCDWWLRTPVVGGAEYAGFIRSVFSFGPIAGRLANSLLYLRPALVLRGTYASGASD